MPLWGKQPQERVCEANWRRSLCAAKRDPRLRGCTPLRTPIRKSEGPQATRTQYYCSRLTPVGLPPLLSREFPRTPDADNGCCVGAAYMPPVTYRSNPSTGKGGGLPPALVPLVHNLFTAVRRGRACPARNLPSNPICGQFVGEGFIPPGRLSAAANGHGGQRAGRPTYAPGRTADLRGVEDAAPYNRCRKPSGRL